LTWKEAQDAASEWIGTLRLGRDLTGKVINLNAEPFPFSGHDRNVVLEAVRRKLKKRGAKEVILPPLE
jgi:hypothetical protein